MPKLHVQSHVSNDYIGAFVWTMIPRDLIVSSFITMTIYYLEYFWNGIAKWLSLSSKNDPSCTKMYMFISVWSLKFITPYKWNQICHTDNQNWISTTGASKITNLNLCWCSRYCKFAIIQELKSTTVFHSKRITFHSNNRWNVFSFALCYFADSDIKTLNSEWIVAIVFLLCLTKCQNRYMPQLSWRTDEMVFFIELIIEIWGKSLLREPPKNLQLVHN